MSAQLFLCGTAEKIVALIDKHSKEGYYITQSSIAVASGTEQMYVLVVMERR